MSQNSLLLLSLFRANHVCSKLLPVRQVQWWCGMRSSLSSWDGAYGTRVKTVERLETVAGSSNGWIALCDDPLSAILFLLAGGRGKRCVARQGVESLEWPKHRSMCVDWCECRWRNEVCCRLAGALQLPHDVATIAVPSLRL